MYTVSHEKRATLFLVLTRVCRRFYIFVPQEIGMDSVQTYNLLA